MITDYDKYLEQVKNLRTPGDLKVNKSTKEWKESESAFANWWITHEKSIKNPLEYNPPTLTPRQKELFQVRIMDSKVPAEKKEALFRVLEDTPVKQPEKQYGGSAYYDEGDPYEYSRVVYEYTV